MAKSRPTMNLVSKTVARSSTGQSSSASSCPGTLKASSQSLSLKARAGKPAAEDSNENDASPSFQERHSNVKPNASAKRPATTGTNQNLNLSASAGQPAAKGSYIVEVDSEWPKNYQISAASVPHLEKVYSNLLQKTGRKSGDNVHDLDTNSLIWEMSMSATVDAAVHLGTNYVENLHSTKITHNER